MTFNIDVKGITAIIGESGSGKTTFLKCLSGLIKSQYGYLRINNIVFQNSYNNIFINANKRNIGHIMQTPVLFEHLSVLENINFGIKKHLNNHINLYMLIRSLNLEKLLSKNIKQLSGGEKQRVCIAQIMLIQPDVILLDESFSAQDIKMKNKLFSFFKELNIKYSIPIICVSHNITEVEKFADHICYMKYGSLISYNFNI
ncbi:MAG TPA: ATP-binding cassette domain-containing protein [Candidatus Azoamicus sp. OHIO2]